MSGKERKPDPVWVGSSRVPPARGPKRAHPSRSSVGGCGGGVQGTSGWCNLPAWGAPSSARPRAKPSQPKGAAPVGPQLQPDPLLQGLGRWAEAVGQASQATGVGAGEEAELLPRFHRFLCHGREGGFPPSSRSGCQINARRGTSTHVYFCLFSPKGGNVGYSLSPFTVLPGAHPFLPLGERTRSLFQHRHQGRLLGAMPSVARSPSCKSHP